MSNFEVLRSQSSRSFALIDDLLVEYITSSGSSCRPERLGEICWQGKGAVMRIYF